MSPTPRGKLAILSCVGGWGELCRSVGCGKQRGLKPLRSRAPQPAAVPRRLPAGSWSLSSPPEYQPKPFFRASSSPANSGERSVENNVISPEESPRFSNRVFAVLEKVNWNHPAGRYHPSASSACTCSTTSLERAAGQHAISLDLVRTGLYDVAGSRTDVAQANDLLTELIEQRSRLNSASASLTVIDHLTDDVSRSATKANRPTRRSINLLLSTMN